MFRIAHLHTDTHSHGAPTLGHHGNPRTGCPRRDERLRRRHRQRCGSSTSATAAATREGPATISVKLSPIVEQQGKVLFVSASAGGGGLRRRYLNSRWASSRPTGVTPTDDGRGLPCARSYLRFLPWMHKLRPLLRQSAACPYSTFDRGHRRDDEILAPCAGSDPLRPPGPERAGLPPWWPV